MSEQWGNAAGAGNQFNADWVSHPDNRNILKVNDVNQNNDAKFAIHAINKSTSANARALKIEGIAEFLGRAEAGDAVIKVKNCTITNSDNGDGILLQPSEGGSVIISPGAYVLVVSGGLSVVGGETNISSLLRATADIQCDEQLRCDRLFVGKLRDGLIDAWTANRDLLLGTDEQTTRDVKISRAGQTTTVHGDLTVEEDLLVDGSTLILNDASIESSGADDLRIGTEGNNIYVLISRAAGTTIINGIGIVKGHLGLGDLNNDGHIDCNAVEANNRELQIGTQNSTCAVIIGRDGRRTIVRSDVLKVGQADEPGLIESGGTTAAPEDLNIGTNGETNGVTLGRAGVTIDVQCQARLNGNALIMNGAASILDVNGCGQVFNAVGHPGPNMPCMDQYINGVVVGWIDANGWNNA